MSLLNKDDFQNFSQFQQAAEIESIQNEWILKQNEIEALNSFYNSLVCSTDEDTTLDLTINDIREKIKSLIKINVNDEWIIKNFKDAIKLCKAYTHKTTFNDFLNATQVFYNINAFPPAIASSSVEVVTLFVKFDIAKVMDILGPLMTNRLAWERYTYD